MLKLLYFSSAYWIGPWEVRCEILHAIPVHGASVIWEYHRVIADELTCLLDEHEVEVLPLVIDPVSHCVHRNKPLGGGLGHHG